MPAAYSKAAYDTCQTTSHIVKVKPYGRRCMVTLLAMDRFNVL